MKIRKSAVFNIISILTLINFAALMCDIFLIDRSYIDSNYEDIGITPYGYLLKCTSFGITLVILLFYPYELHLEEKGIKLTNFVSIKNSALKKIHSFFFYIGYILFIIRFIIFIIFNVVAIEFMWDL